MDDLSWLALPPLALPPPDAHLDLPAAPSRRSITGPGSDVGTSRGSSGSEATKLRDAHPTNEKSSARVGVRRMTVQMRKVLPQPMKQQDLIDHLAEPVRRAAAVRGAAFHFQTSDGVASCYAPAFAVPNSLHLKCVRRIGSYRESTHRGGLFMCSRDGLALSLPFESMLELAWLMEFDRESQVLWQQTQPLVITWRAGDRGLYRVPDILLRTKSGWVVIDVKPKEALDRSPYTQAIYALTRDTLAKAGVRYAVVGNMSALRQRSLAAISRWRSVAPELAAGAKHVLELRPDTLGGVIDAAGGGNSGAVSALHLMSHGLEHDLETPITISAHVEWLAPTTESAPDTLRNPFAPVDVKPAAMPLSVFNGTRDAKARREDESR